MSEESQGKGKKFFVSICDISALLNMAICHYERSEVIQFLGFRLPRKLRFLAMTKCLRDLKQCHFEHSEESQGKGKKSFVSICDISALLNMAICHYERSEVIQFLGFRLPRKLRFLAMTKCLCD